MIKTGDLISTAEVAALLGKSIRTVHRMAAAGEIPATKLGPGTASWVFEKADIEQYQQQSAA